jgi:hypothetical protein
VVVFDVKSLVQRSMGPDACLFEDRPLWNTNGLGIVYCRLVLSNTYWQQPYMMMLAQICKHEIMTLLRWYRFFQKFPYGTIKNRISMSGDHITILMI